MASNKKQVQPAKQSQPTTEKSLAELARQDALKDMQSIKGEKNMATKTKTAKTVKPATEETPVNPGKVAAEKRATLHLIAPNQRTAGGQIFNLKIGSIITLKEAGIEDSSLAMRPIEKQNLESLILADDAAIPPIRVQNSDKGYILIDGGHRLARAINLARIRYNKVVLSDDIPDLIAALNTLPSEIGEEENKYIQSCTIKCVAEDFKTTREAVRACFSANLALGKSASKEHRSRYALWLMKVAKEDGTPLTLREASRQAGVSHVSVIHYRDAKKRQTENGAEVPAESVERQKADKDDKAASSLVKSMRSLFPSLTAMAMPDAVQFLTGYCKTDDMGMLAGFRNILQQVEVALASELDAMEDDETEDDSEDYE